MPEFRFIFAVEGHVRLAQHPTEGPAAATFEWDRDTVRLRDMIDEREGVPRHRILGVEVSCRGGALDTLFDHASELAETTLILVSCAARAPTMSADFLLAYETTPDADERAFLQWVPVPEMPQARIAAPEELLGALFYKVQEAVEENPKLGQRLILSMSWYRRALRETDVLFRFMNLWFGLEALNPRLYDLFSLSKTERTGLEGIKRLMAEVPEGEEGFSVATAARNDLLHANRVRPTATRRKVTPIIPILDQALVLGWQRLLALPETPEIISSVWPNPYRFVVQATVRPDSEGWSESRPPYVEVETPLAPIPSDDPNNLSFTMTPSFTFQNVYSAANVRWELRGPEMPNSTAIRNVDADITKPEARNRPSG